MRTLSILPLALGFLAMMGCSPAVQKAPEGPTKAALVAAAPAARVDPSELVALEASPANKFVRASESGELTVRLRLSAQTLKSGPKPPVNLALVVDTSGSMEGQAIEDAKKASLALLDALSPGDSLAVVAYHSRAEVLAPSTRLDTKTIGSLRAQIAAMKAHGTTDMAGGLKTGLNEVLKGFRADGVNRVVLVGDGVPNNELPILPLAQQAAQSRVPVTVLGLGLDYNETLMNAVAQHSGGKFHFVRESSAVASVFQEEVLRLKQVVAKNTSLRIATGPGVTIKGVVGLPWSAQGTETVVGLGDMSEGEQRDVIVKLDVAGRRAGSVVELFDAALSFDGAAAGAGRLEEQSFVSARATADREELASGRDVDVERSAARVSIADRIVQAIAAARAGQLAQAQDMLDDVERDARRAAMQYDDNELLAKAKSIPSLKKSLPSLVSQPTPVAAPTAATPSLGVPMPRPEAAAVVMESQAAAVRTLQGL